MEQLRIVIGCDDAGLDYKKALLADLRESEGVASVQDVGVGDAEHTAYPHVAVQAARMVAAGEADRALLVCGTGLGVAISANKVPGIRAALCHDAATAKGARVWNHANVLGLSLRATPEPVAKEILDAWFETPYSDDEWNLRQMRRIEELERKYRRG